MIINSANLSSLFVSLQASFNIGLTVKETFWQHIATEMPSTTSENIYHELGEFPDLREWLGDRHIKRLSAKGYSIVNKKFEATIGIAKDKLEDDQYQIFSKRFEMMGHAVATHPDKLVYGLLPEGFNSPGFDGQNFFDTDHPVGDEETGIQSVSNMQAGSGAPWFLIDDTRPIKPMIWQKRKDYKLTAMTKDDDESVFMRDEFRYGVDARVNTGFAIWQLAFGSKADLTITNFDAAMTQMGSLKSDQGRPLGVMPNKLICGISNRAAAKKVVDNARLANGEDNHNYKAVEVVVVPWLA
ncbi:Mu-like prophage major head subunit gpT family protein [Thalassomonas viridans]|uniref:Mu-like prophage major head subunit gpT family protein n=1 Tax=Thalassomonas viridans TaxID=137584 RepID=A0AAF0C9A4_9GAMM|nr:Mu-like prophage major head subunit gpT family protein [Thalassomonas viridans]WDE07287.1 Mu-like prophage major head subunit gpT family protein [Thalassomonas viridans]